ncbi:MAG: BTAD domain-containing putative transcriptional regulator [Bradyrhizobium sp.]|nr:BTAD domain-containing putative transcriptional regulator [Bradyrhizobium sp.]
MENGATLRPVCRLFGRLEVWSRHGTRVEFLSERSKHLFAVLVLQKGAPVSRDVLVARLWTDGPDERLRRNLSTEVWRLRCALERAGEDGSRWINARPEALSLRMDEQAWIDIEVFDQCVRKSLQSIGPGPLATLESIEQLYRGDLLPELEYDWCLAEREAYRNRFLACLEALLLLAKQRSDWRESIRIARRILAEDSFLEHIHREIMLCHAMMGDRVAALRHYEKLQFAFRQELGVSPARETTALYNRLRDDGGQRPDPAVPEAAADRDVERRLALIQQHLHQLNLEVRAFASLLQPGPPAS